MEARELFAEDFESYRRLEVDKALVVLRQLLSGQVDSEFFKGAMWMLKTIINIPLDVARTPEAKERAKFLKETMLGQFEASLVRGFLDAEEKPARGAETNQEERR